MKNLCNFYQDPYNLAAFSSSFDKNGEIIFVSEFQYIRRILK